MCYLYLIFVIFKSHNQQIVRFHYYLPFVGAWACLLAMPCRCGLKRPKQLSITANILAHYCYGRFKGELNAKTNYKLFLFESTGYIEKLNIETKKTL